jgi:hypothetical protein
MINRLLKGLTDVIYRTAHVKHKFEKNNPNERVLAANASKGIRTTQEEGLQYGTHWVGSQRAVIVLTEKRIICGEWTIPLNTIASAQLLKINTMLGSGQVLKIQTTDNQFYQFGMQLNPAWTEQTKLPLTVEKGKMTYSLFSIIFRVFGTGYFIYWLYRQFF